MYLMSVLMEFWEKAGRPSLNYCRLTLKLTVHPDIHHFDGSHNYLNLQGP
jgi:hypothetical protein